MGLDSIGTMISSHGVIALVLLPVLFALWRSGFFHRLSRIIEEMMFSNWQLALLGATAVALSLASGYTTFDGLRNFTSAPLLSALVAFGIQGVMLIVAWLIGESFATGMNRQVPRGPGFSTREAVFGMGLGAALVALLFAWALSRYDAVDVSGVAGTALRVDWRRFADVALTFLTGLALLGLVAFVLRRGGDVARPYVQSLRLVAKNSVLWVMFLASMGASVFFSFDSHFNAIFPADQRQRAAEIRTLGQVAGVVADIGERARKAQVAEAQRLFESEGWRSYDARLARLALAARSAQAEIEAFFVRKLEERQRGVGEQQERIAAAERSRTALLRRRDELEAELHRLEPSIGALEAELAKAQATYDATRQAIAAKRIDASAEDGGVEGTLKPGKGPAWRRRMAELDELHRKLAVSDEPRLEEARRQRDLASARIVGLKREIATLVAEVAKYKGQISTAEHRITTAQAGDGSSRDGRVDPAHVLPAFERARAAFRRQPEAGTLAALQAHCGTLLGAMSATPATTEKVRGIDCDPKSAAEAAARLFALNAGLAVFRAACAGGSRLPRSASTDDLLSFGRRCLQDAGLASKEAADLGARLQAIEMNRDDRAHRFVVTWNAFLDGNRLSYLALALAVGVDALVFMAGLFGAAAVKSPLSDIPGIRARSAEQLEAVVRNALGEDRLRNADLVLAAMRPAPGIDDQRSEVDLAPYDADRAERIRKVLVAGRSIGAVERVATDGGGERYLVRPELFEYLSIVADAARASGREQSRTGAPPAPRIDAKPARPAAAAVPRREASDVAAPRLLTDGRGGGGLSQDPDEGDLRRRLGEAMFDAVASEAKAVAAELRRQAEAHGDLRAVLEGIERESRRTLERAARALTREQGDDEQARQLMSEARREIAPLVPALILRSELGLLDDLIEVVERTGDDTLLRRLRMLRNAIDELNPADGAAWTHVARQIRQLSGRTG